MYNTALIDCHQCFENFTTSGPLYIWLYALEQGMFHSTSNFCLEFQEYNQGRRCADYEIIVIDHVFKHYIDHLCFHYAIPIASLGYEKKSFRGMSVSKIKLVLISSLLNESKNLQSSSLAHSQLKAFWRKVILW